MAQKKGSLLRYLFLFLVIEVVLIVLSSGLNKQLQVGYDDTGKFVFQNVEKEYDLQDKIQEEFQPDEYAKQNGISPKFYGSSALYDFFAKIFGKANAISAFNLIRMLIIVDLVLLLVAFLIKKQLFEKPSKPQIIFEMIYTTFEDFVKDTLGKEKLHFTPYIVTLFIFIWTCNMIGLVPIPGFMEPTRNLNVPLGLGIMAVAVVHYMSIKTKGLGKYLKDFTQPLPPMTPINIVGEFSKVISISFRLFGNILGGAIIVLVVSSLVKFIILPVGLNLFFGIFVGTIQAFVFTMLALTYIGVEIAE
ncbi:MAG: F-type H+-transporting ATPase subunit a [Candidatus Cloacimonadota bacterium]|jgi:F-type H+-transporting ATPase subunit a|nr:F-type H+-transporting ATPase subunit a [Candidatus Cloacimonadota bacterium]